MTEENKKQREADGPFMDNPENLPTDKESIYDMHEDMQNVDPIPLEDLRMEAEEERHKEKTKDRSSTEKKFRNE